MQPNHHAHYRIGHTLFIFGAFLLLIFSTILAPLSSASTRAFGVSDIIKGSNDARAQLGLPPLNTSPDLLSGAQMKAEDMAKQHYFAHVAPDGTVAWDYFKKVGYSYTVAGENLALTNEDSSAVINGWLNSPTHRANLLSEQYTDMGIGMAAFGDYEGHKNTYVIVAFYGRRSATNNQSLTATTNPAGGTTTMKPQLPIASPSGVAASAVILMSVGIMLELRHIHRLHHSKRLA